VPRNKLSSLKVSGGGESVPVESPGAGNTRAPTEIKSPPGETFSTVACHASDGEYVRLPPKLDRCECYSSCSTLNALAFWRLPRSRNFEIECIPNR